MPAPLHTETSLQEGGQGIDIDATQIWKFLCHRPGAWWTAQRLANAWAPTFELADVQAHLDTLAKGQFLDTDKPVGGQPRYAVNANVRALPGLDEFMRTARENASRPAPVTEPRRIDVMHGATYTPEADTPSRPEATKYREVLSRGHRC